MHEAVCASGKITSIIVLMISNYVWRLQSLKNIEFFFFFSFFFVVVVVGTLNEFTTCVMYLHLYTCMKVCVSVVRLP